MKKFSKLRNITVFVLTLTFLLLFSYNVSYAEENEEGFKIEDGTLTSYNGPGGYIEIPSTVTTIADNVFSGNASITGVVIPDSVQTIGSYAFSGCSNLTSVNVSAATNIGTGAFYGCGSLSSVSLPSGLSQISPELFQNCGSLVEISIPGNVTSIGAGAFQGCANLSSISIPGGVTSIGAGAFQGCSSLSSVTIPASVSSLGTGVFAECSNLSSVTMETGVSIPELAFYNSVSLSSFSVPSGTDSIGSNAFGGSGISSISIPSSVSSIDLSAFDGCKNLTNITIAEGGTYASHDGCIYDAGLTKLIYCPEGKNSINIAETTKIIGSQSLSDCTFIANVTLPNSVVEIEANAFSNSGVKALTIPVATTTIGTQSAWTPDVIYGYTGSVAEQFAKDNNYIFESIGSVPGTGDENDGDDNEDNNGSNNGDDGNNGDGNTGGDGGDTGSGTSGGGTSSNVGGATVRPNTNGTRVKDATPKTAAGVEAKLFLFGSMLMIGAYLVISKRKIKKI